MELRGSFRLAEAAPCTDVVLSCRSVSWRLFPGAQRSPNRGTAQVGRSSKTPKAQPHPIPSPSASSLSATSTSPPYPESGDGPLGPKRCTVAASRVGNVPGRASLEDLHSLFREMPSAPRRAGGVTTSARHSPVPSPNPCSIRELGSRFVEQTHPRAQVPGWGQPHATHCPNAQPPNPHPHPLLRGSEQTKHTAKSPPSPTATTPYSLTPWGCGSSGTRMQHCHMAAMARTWSCSGEPGHSLGEAQGTGAGGPSFIPNIKKAKAKIKHDTLSSFPPPTQTTKSQLLLLL